MLSDVGLVPDNIDAEASEDDPDPAQKKHKIYKKKGLFKCPMISLYFLLSFQEFSFISYIYYLLIVKHFSTTII